MKKMLFIIIYIVLFFTFTFSINSTIKFSIVFGSKVETGISANLYFYYSPDEWAFLKIKSNFYPINIKINDQNVLLFSDDQLIVVKPGKIKITYNNNSFFYLAEKGNNLISLVKNIQLKPKIKIINYTNTVSPNNDWYNDKFKIELNSNTYAHIKIKIMQKEFEKDIFPGDNKIYFDFSNIQDDIYTIQIKVYNDKGDFEKNLKVIVDRNRKSYGREFLFGFIIFFAGIIIWNSF